MSDGKSSRYTVVSPTELRRRALATAQDRLARAIASLAELAIEVSAAEATYGQVGVSLPRPVTGGTDPAQVDASAERLEQELTSARGQVSAHVKKARSDRLDKLTGDLLSKLRPTSPLAPLADRPVAPPSAVRVTLDKALEVVARLPAASPPEVAQRCTRLVEEIASAVSDTRRDTLLTSLRFEIQEMSRVVRLVDANRVIVNEFHVYLDGLIGAEVEALRGKLRGLPLDSSLPASLRGEVHDAAQAARRAADRAFALSETKRALKAQGYEIDESFVTIAATEAGALLPVSSSQHHGLRVRERDGRMLLNLVRFDEDGLPDREEDVQVADIFCESFSQFVGQMTDNGLALSKVAHLPSDSGRMEIRRRPSPFDKRESPAACVSDVPRARQQR